MSAFGWFVFVVLPILGGLIAWAGDVIGYRLGKSRRSLFGLRPRTTARLVGVAVGVALPFIGVGTALVGSGEARDALFHIDELRRQEQWLQAQNKELEAKRQRALEQARASTQRSLALRRDLYATRTHLHQTRQQVRAAYRQLTQAEARLRETATRAQRLQALASQLQGLIGRLRHNVAHLQAALNEKTRALAEKGREVEEKTKELTVRQAELRARETDLERLKAAFMDAIRLINSPVELETGHELVRMIVETGETVEETEERIFKVLLAASEAAAAHGAVRGPGGLAVRPIRPLPPELAEGQALPDVAAVVRTFAKDLQAAGKRTFVIGVRVARRMYRQEAAPVGVELWALPYVRVFLENEVIYAVEIDGAQPRAEIFKQLWNLVTKIVRREAREKGLLPNPETGEYGTIDIEQLFEAMEQIAAHRGPALVRVMAAADTYIVDPLLIRIVVGEEKSSRREPNRASD